MGSVARKLLAFLRRDLAISASYRLQWGFQVVNILLFVAALYFMARLVDSGAAPALAPYRGYFSFVLVGIAVSGYFLGSLSRLAQSLRESQVNGTLEVVLVTGTSPFALFLYSYLAILLVELLEWALFFFVGLLGFGFSMSQANWVSATLLFALGIALFLGFGLISVSFILVFKKGDPLNWILGSVAWLISGALFPVELLPDWLRVISQLYPVTPLLTGLRKALVLGAGLADVRAEALTVAGFAGLLLVVGYGLFHWALRRAQWEGSLSHY